ncbi:hypothetical protein K7I13_15115 [Brucepastera parasyntrophica]|uniref:hypothetical protein n=1 Tax=Brucepastera parasyntrophica TaxID=2880008 RepID=UPI00210D521C|nr:hypothetical protein [Brucepastera parasyntrophica]ULQ59758.1 hypothetical protein K7I13_15115 [Brucepastera parasyntrophica]
MMKIRLNNEDIDFEIKNEQTLGEILGQIEEACEKEKNTITSIKIDGKEISPGELDGFFSKSPQNFSLIELGTISGEDVRYMLQAVGQRFSASIDQLQNIPVLLQTGKDLAVMEAIKLLSENFRELNGLIPLIPLAGIDPAALQIEDSELSAFLLELPPILTDLLGALEKKDTILIGDISEYELAPRIEKLSEVLKAV